MKYCVNDSSLGTEINKSRKIMVINKNIGVET